MYSLICIRVVWVSERLPKDVAFVDNGFFFQSGTEESPKNVEEFLLSSPGEIYMYVDSSAGNGFENRHDSVFDFESYNIGAEYILESEIEMIFDALKTRLERQMDANKKSKYESQDVAAAYGTFLHSIEYSGPDYDGEYSAEYELIGLVDINELANRMIKECNDEHSK